MKKHIFIIIVLSVITTKSFAAGLERYVPVVTSQMTNIPAPHDAALQQVQMPQQNLSTQKQLPQQNPQQQQVIQPVYAPSPASAPKLKKFDLSGKKSSSNHKKKNPKKRSGKKTVQAAVPAKKAVEAQTKLPPFQYIDIQSFLAKSKLMQVEEKKEATHASQVEKSTQKPDEAIKDMAKTVYVFIPGSLYTMWCKKGFVTDIELQVGESITSVNGGDTVRWLVEQTVSGGNGVPETKHVLVKPHQADLQTNLIIFTDKRTYRLKASSSENTYNPIISWSYPADERSTMLFVQKQATKEKAEVITEESVSPEAMNFNYSIKSNSGIFADEYNWTPIKAFNDGNKTYIQVNPQMKKNESPAFFVKDREGNINLVNYRLKNNYFIVDRLFESAELRNGVDEIVTIKKESK